MTASGPAWRIKSRPCPFYQQGRCLFADSCNFLHNVSAKLSSEVCVNESSHKLDPFVPRNMSTPPIITVDSPRVINSSHSPRLPGLLNDLNGVIGEDATKIMPDLPSTPYPPDKSGLVNDENIISCSSDKEGNGHITVDILESFSTTSGSGNLSVSQGTFPDNYEGDAESYSEDELTLRPSNSRIISASVSSGRSRPSPLNIETAIPPIFDFSENDNEGVIDSGYAESWHSHNSSPRTPPRTRTRSSTLVLLRSPFGSPSDKIQAQAGFLVKLGLNMSVEQPPDAISDISLDCPKDCDSPRHEVIISSPDVGEDVPQTNLDVFARSVFPRMDFSQIQAAEPIIPGRRLDEQALLPSNGPDENWSDPSLDPSLESSLQEQTIKDLVSSDRNIPNGVPHLYAESALVESPALPVQENGFETLDKNALSRDTTQSALANSSNKNSSCGSPLQRAFTSLPHSPSSLNSQKRLSTSTPRQCYYPMRNSTSSTTSSRADGARRISFGWKNWGRSRTRASDPAMSKQPMRRPSDPTMPGSKASDRKYSEFVPAHCPSYDCAPLKSPAVVSPEHTTIIHISNSTSISPQSSTTASMLSLSSSVSSAKYSTPDYLPSPSRLSMITHRISTSIPTPDATIPSPLSFTSLDLKNFSNFSENVPRSTGSRYIDCHDPSELGKFRFSKQNSEPLLYRIDEQEDSRTEDQHRNTPSDLSKFQFPKKNPEPPVYPVDEHDSRYTKPTPTISCRSVSSQSPSQSIAMPKPTLFFAIASDNADEVRQVLKSGEVGPNESIGPQSALEFVLTNDQLMHKVEIVKVLLAYGANPSVVRKYRIRESITLDSEGRPGSVETIDPATSYFLEKAEAAERQRTIAMMRRSSFRAVTRVRYEMVGQDRVLDQLFKVLRIHTRQLSPAPMVVLFSGPSGHGKSILARKFGSLLEVPTHIVNMTILRTTHELWQSRCMDPDNQTSGTSTLAEFLTKNEGKRCVVVLDEIEKTVDEKVLWSLLMPWEHGQCLVGAGSRPIDVRNVIWIGTSNVGQDTVFHYQESKEHPHEPISKEEYTELMGLVRSKMSAHLGASMVSRVTAILPFVPFTPEERRVVCFEALYSLAGDEIREVSSKLVDRMIENAMVKFRPQEGARSLYRAISDQLAVYL